MGKKLGIAVAVCILLMAGLIAAYKLLPKRYLVAERLSQTTVFWNDKEAFVFLDLMKIGRAQNFVQQKIASGRWGFLVALSGIDFTEQQVVAYRLSDAGALAAFSLPQDATIYGKWKLVNGNLQVTPAATPYRSASGFRWDGSRFQTVPAEALSSAGTRIHQNLSEDDADEDSAPQSIIADKSERRVFKNAGWHWKTVSGYATATDDATLPMSMGSTTFNLVIHSAASQESSDAFDLFAGGAELLEISGGTLANAAVLWKNRGWRPIPKSEFEQHAARRGPTAPMTIWIWLAVALLLMGWKALIWGRTIYTFFTVKKSVLKNVATTYSFPPAVPGQFPQLDTAALERSTREWESLGFERLLDTAPTPDGENYPATFCRLLVHSRHHCFAQVMQLFPKGKAPLAMKTAVVSYLQEGWSLGFSDRKPLPGSALIRRPKAIGVSMPHGKPAELLHSLLSLRQQVCFDLGISPLMEDTVQGYVARVQETAKDIRTAIEKRNFLAGVPQYYYRKLGLMRTKPEYVWLGDYPKVAEQRKRAFDPVPVG